MEDSLAVRFAALRDALEALIEVIEWAGLGSTIGVDLRSTLIHLRRAEGIYLARRQELVDRLSEDQQQMGEW